MPAVRVMLENDLETCANQDNPLRTPACRSKVQTRLKEPYPAQLMFGLNWEELPAKSAILRAMLAIPQVFDLDELYECPTEEPP